MTLRPYKFQIVAIVQEVDEDVSVVAERATDPVVVFGVAALAEWAAKFEAELALLEGRE